MAHTTTGSLWAAARSGRIRIQAPEKMAVDRKASVAADNTAKL